MALKGCVGIPEEQDILMRLISNARDGLEWLTEMEALVDELHENAKDVEVATNRCTGQFVEVIIKAYFDTSNPPEKATSVMGDYEWDESSIAEADGQWRLRLKRRYSYA